MAEHDRIHLMPIEARKRHLIAASHTARIRMLYGSSETELPEPPILPVWLTSDDVIGLIAYGKTRAVDGPAPGAPAMFERWRGHVSEPPSDERQYPRVRQFRRLLARVRWWRSRKQKCAVPARCPVPPLDPITRGHIRWVMRHRKVPAIQAIALLRADVRKLIAAQHAHEVNIGNAVAILGAEIAAEHITAWGVRGARRIRHYFTGIHEKIPPEFFANHHTTILADGWATCAWDESVPHWADWDHPDWGHVRFKRDGVQRLMKDTQPLALVTSSNEEESNTRRDRVPTAALLDQTTNQPESSDLETTSVCAPSIKLAIRNRPGGGGKKKVSAIEAMVRAVRDHRGVTFEDLRGMKQKQLESLFPQGRRTMLVQAREAALQQLVHLGYSDKSPT